MSKSQNRAIPVAEVTGKAVTKPYELPVGISTNGDAIAKMIALITRSKAKLESAIINASVSAILHAIEHGNATPMTNLDKALSGSFVRANAFRQWVIDSGPFVWRETETARDGTKRPAQFGIDSEKLKVYRKTMADNETADAYVLELMVPFWQRKAEPEFKPLDIPKAIGMLLKRAEKAAKDETHKAEHNLTGLAKLRIIAEELKVA